MIHIRLTEICNFKCFFCHIPQLKPKDLGLMDAINLVKAVDHSSPKIFSISGGEPTAVPYLYKLIKYIKYCNKNHFINIETNGFFLCRESYVEKLVKAGLDSLLLSFHSHKPDVFNQITGIKNSFSIMEKTLNVLKNFNLNIEISFVLCQYNYNEIEDTVKYLNDKIYYKGFLVSNIFEKINYGKKQDFHIELQKIAEPIQRAYKLLNLLGKEISSCGIPMCYLKGYEDSYYLGQYDENRYYRKSDECNKCVFNSSCRGVIGEFADLYGLDGIKAIKYSNPIMINKVSILKEEYLSKADIRINNHS